MSQFDWPITQKKVGTMEAPQNRRFYGKMECLPPFGPTYIGQKGRTLGKRNGIKARWYWEHSWGTHWEPNGNLKGTFLGGTNGGSYLLWAVSFIFFREFFHGTFLVLIVWWFLTCCEGAKGIAKDEPNLFDNFNWKKVLLLLLSSSPLWKSE